MKKPSPTTSSLEYRAARKLRGPQWSVACLLGVTPMTICRRERGICPVTIEAWLALTSLPVKKSAQTTGGRTTFSGLTPGVAYTAQVNAVGAAGPSDWSNPVSKMAV